MAPNGLIANLSGTAEGKPQDSGMMTDSGLLNFLQQFSFDPNGNLYASVATLHIPCGLTPQQTKTSL